MPYTCLPLRDVSAFFLYEKFPYMQGISILPLFYLHLYEGLNGYIRCFSMKINFPFILLRGTNLPTPVTTYNSTHFYFLGSRQRNRTFNIRLMRPNRRPRLPPAINFFTLSKNSGILFPVK